MKRFLNLLILVNCCHVFGQDIPEKLLLSSKLFSENQSLYPIYKIDLIVFSHKQINEGDKKEQFPKLQKFVYSSDLIKLLNTPNLLVKKQAIEGGFTTGTQTIQTIDLDQKQNVINIKEENNDNNANIILLPYEYFELTDANDLNKKFVSRLNRRKEYEVLFHGSWFQPLFKADLSSPVYINAENEINGVHGELLIYKERFLHSYLRLRLSERTNVDLTFNSVKLYNFNNLIKLSKAENRFLNFFKFIGEEFISFSSWIMRTKEFTPVSTSNNTPLSSSNYKDLYEINQRIKMKQDSYHYIDHPYFGAVLKVSLWPSK